MPKNSTEIRPSSKWCPSRYSKVGALFFFALAVEHVIGMVKFKTFVALNDLPHYKGLPFLDVAISVVPFLTLAAYLILSFAMVRATRGKLLFSGVMLLCVSKFLVVYGALYRRGTPKAFPPALRLPTILGSIGYLFLAFLGITFAFLPKLFEKVQNFAFSAVAWVLIILEPILCILAVNNGICYRTLFPGYISTNYVMDAFEAGRTFCLIWFVLIEVAVMCLFIWLTHPEWAMSLTREELDCEHRMKCNVCGKVYCYTLREVKQSSGNAALVAMMNLASAANFIGGSMLVGFAGTNSANKIQEKVVDYFKCPQCGSRDVRECGLYEKDESVKEEPPKKEVPAPVPAPEPTAPVSAADELKKFKELLDSGVITQEEFDAKKKQLLEL